MSFFNEIMSVVNDIVWSLPLIGLCMGAAVFFSFYFRLPQVRLFKDMVNSLTEKGDDDVGISPFQTFATTVGSRVGMGNIAGVATAIYFGGPGAVFWMLFMGFFAASSALVETTLAQAYKDVTDDGEYVGGPQLFIEKALNKKWLAVLFALATVIGPGILMPGLHTYSIASTFENAFGVDMLIVGIVSVAILGLVVWGGIKRIGKVAELMAPVMTVIYVLIAVVILVMNFEKFPGAVALIVKSAFGLEPLFAGIIGAAIQWGVKRGLYSNEAGQGSGAIVSAAAETSHPVKQGLIQALSVFIDTLIVCSSSAIIIMVTEKYNVINGNGEFIVSHIPDIEYGIRWAQEGLISAFGSLGGKALAIIIIMFVFTSLMGYYYEAESTMRYLTKNSSAAVKAMKIIFLGSTFSGVLFNGEVIWMMGDIGAGLMAWFNIIAILLLSKKAKEIFADYENQRNSGLDPMFNPVDVGIVDQTGAWKKYAQRRIKAQRKEG
ncbi:MAG: alanine/glycine:cation symporter family protein [Tissierellia bacterium]|nr:alanine/glycine:cation symporter family protein [Tissierellia bacterium]